MLSLDLFDSKYEKKLHEGAVDDTIAHLIEPLSRRAMDIRTQLRSRRLDPAQVAKLEKEYEELVQKRLDIILDRKPQTEQQSQPPAKGLLKGKDLITPQQRVAGATPAKPGVAGAVKDVAGGIKRWLKGEPDSGPTYENQEPQQSPRALGVANFQRLVKANMGNVPTVSFEFIRPEENFKLDQKGLDLISDYYDGLENDQAKNYFIYRVLPSGDETLKVLKQLGWTPQQVQPSLPGIPTQGELPLSEKKKSKTNNDLQAGDVKVARELQKLRAQYPAARSDVEAVARAEIDSTERSQQQLAAIRGANEKQDALLKQLVALDQEQGREISGLDKENNSLEQRLAQVQTTNNRLQQAVVKMTGNKKTATKAADVSQKGSVDLAQGGIIDVGTPVPLEPDTTSATDTKTTTPSAMGNIARTVTAPKAPSTAKDTEKFDKDKEEPLEKPVTSLKALRSQQAANRDEFRLVGEHGGGIGPRQHWQDLMQETVTDVRPLWAKAYHRLAPKIERYRDSFLAGQLYDELENIAELHGAEKEFKQMMSTARNSAHMEYDTNPGGFHNWFWFLPFDDEQVNELDVNTLKSYADKRGAQVAAMKADNPNPTAGSKEWIQQAVPAQQVNLAKRKIARKERQQGMAEGLKPGEYNIHTVYFKDGTKKRIRVTSDEFDVVDYYTKRGQAVDRVDYDFQIHSNVTEDLIEGIKDTAGATAVIACLLTGGSLTGCATAPQQTSAQQVLKTGQDIGRTVQTAKRITRAGTEAEVQQELRNILRGVSGRPEELNHSNILRIWRRVNEPNPQQNEAREIVSKEDFVRERDRLLRMIGQETNPANKQILKSAIRQLENRAENEGWITIQNRMVREDNDGSEAVEMAIMRRMLIAHTNLIVEFGLDKVVNAIEEVAYNVGDTDEIGSSDVSGWVNQVRQILGADA
jgi:hypothetical protein